MRQILRQIVAVLALVGISMSIAPSTFAATYTDVSAANKLATAGIIVDHAANAAMYRLADNVLRQEALGIAGKVSGVITSAPVSEYTCLNTFSDVSEAWVCRAAELGVKAGFVNGANATFRPKANVSRYEALLWAIKANNISISDTSVAGVGARAAELGLITSAAAYNGTAAATRGDVFRYNALAMDYADANDITVDFCALLGICPEEGGNGGSTGGNGSVSVSLASSSPAGYTVPKEASGLHVVSYKVTAAADTTLSGAKLKRMGLSDDDDVSDFTILANGVRVSDPKDENSDDEVNLTFKNGGVVVKAGQTVTLDVLVNVGNDAVAPIATAGAEFAVSLVSLTAGGSVSGLPVMGSIFKVGTSVASEITIDQDGSVSAPDLGQMGADVFRFKVKNDNGTNDTISLHSITFEQVGSANTATELANFVLKQGSTVLATTAMSSGDFVTFNLTTPLSVAQGNNVSLKVSADIIGGAGETIDFEIDNELDVRASSTRYGNAIGVDISGFSISPVTVDAGAITLVKMDATATKIREDKDDQVLGTLKVIAAQADLEIKDIGIAIKVASTTGTGPACVAGSDDADCYIEDVQLRDTKTGARYDLTAGTFSVDTQSYVDTSFDFTLPKGETTFEVIADTLNNITAFDDVDFTLSLSADVTNDANGMIVIEETSDDQVVTDITPSSLTWKKVEGSESGATVSVLSLADLTRVRGATDVIAAQIEIKADESSSLTIDEMKALVQTNTDGVTGTATSQMISQVSLYKGSTVDATMLLDSVSGSNLASGVATFEGFTGGDVVIPANGKQVFTVVLSFVDGADASLAANSPYRVQLAGANIGAKDDENDDVTIGGTYTSARDITITDFGVITLTEDANNDDNEEAKTILAGTTTPIFSVDIQATNEAVDVEKVVFTYSAATGNLLTAGATAELWLGETKIATAPNADITATTITFGGASAGELTNLIIPQEAKELRLAIVSNPIGFEKIGVVVADIEITNVSTDEATGVSSGRDVADASAAITTAALASFVPATITPTVVTSLGTSATQAKIKLTAAFGSNVKSASPGGTPSVAVNTLTFAMPGNNGVVATDYSLCEDGKPGDCVTGTAVGSNVEFDLTGFSGDSSNAISTSRTYVITPSGMASGDTASLTLLDDGVGYDVTGVTGATGFTVNLATDLNFGSRTVN